MQARLLQRPGLGLTAAAGGTLGILIPPSITLIIYGVIAEQSIGKLFVAGIIPACCWPLLFACWVVVQFLHERKQALAGGGHPTSGELLKEESFSWAELPSHCRVCCRSCCCWHQRSPRVRHHGSRPKPGPDSLRRDDPGRPALRLLPLE